MTTNVTRTATTSSTVQTPALVARPKTTTARISDATRRLLNTLMRSLATPHI